MFSCTSGTNITNMCFRYYTGCCLAILHEQNTIKTRLKKDRRTNRNTERKKKINKYIDK